MNNFILFREQAKEIVYRIRIGEVAYAYSLYPVFIDALLKIIDDRHVNAFAPLLNEMLHAQEQNNIVWLADLIEFVLMDSLKDIYAAKL